MSRFLQLHLLTEHPISNPNRDDLGRPKTARIGGELRQRISSQALKRAIRTHDAFRSALEGHTGQRTQRMGEQIIDHLTKNRGAEASRAVAIAKQIVPVFGKLDDKRKPELARTAQLAFVSPDERAAAFDLAERVLAGEQLPKDKDLAKLVMRPADGAVDIAMFGRMLADNADLNRDAAVQVAHAFTVNRVVIEDDFYTAVDDLKDKSEDAGAGFVGEAGFGAGLYYLYVCVNRPLLVENLKGDRQLAARGLEALVRAASMAVPSGKINSFANHARAKYILAERGDAQPVNLAGAFTVPVRGPDLIGEAVRLLEEERKGFAVSYGITADGEIRLHVGSQAGARIAEVASFAAEGL
jgi:CRISPR system Cascade subunit CasC